MISGTPGGVQENVPALVTSILVEPYLILAGDAINISFDGGPPFLVTFFATDTTASRIVNRINLAVAATIAFNDAGRLFLRGIIIGSAGNIILSDAVAGTLAKLGMTPGTTIGANAPIRGIITRSLDNRGGYVVLRTTDGKNVVTDGNFTYQIGEGFAPTSRIVDQLGGSPIHGRLTFDPLASTYSLKYFARGPVPPELFTFNSRFDLLDGTDSITFTFVFLGIFTFGPFAVTFPAGPGLTRDAVVDRINQVWADFSTITNNGQAHVQTIQTQPFSVIGDTLLIAVDGGAFQPVVFTSITAAGIAADINGAIVGVTAAAVGNFVEIRSNNSNGRTSSLNISSGNTEICNKLGLAEGLYRGYFIAEPYGASEIRIRGLGVGPSSSITIAASGATQSRIGLTAGTVVASADGERPAVIPTFFFPGAYLLTYLFPEVLEFGEVDPAAESVVEQFSDKSAGSNRDQQLDNFTNDGQDFSTFGGIPSAGKPVTPNALGVINISFLRPAIDGANRMFKQFIRGDFSYGSETVSALVANNIETTGTAGNPLPPSTSFAIDVDPSNFFPGIRTFGVRFRRDSGPVIPFLVGDGGSFGLSFPYAVNLGPTTSLGNSGSILRFYDVNTLASGGGGLIPLTEPTARTVRIFEKEDQSSSLATHRSLLNKLNASSITITLGDGVNSFGDFNGSNALQSAVAFIHATYGSGTANRSYRLLFKAGQYDINVANGAVDFSNGGASVNKTFILEGISPDLLFGGSGSFLLLNHTGATGLVFGSNFVIFKNMAVSTNLVGTFLPQISVGSNKFHAVECRFNDQRIDFTNSTEVLFSSCVCINTTTAILPAGNPNLRFSAGDGVAKLLTFRDCQFTGTDHNPILQVRSTSSIATLTNIKKILFDNCNFTLGSTTMTGSTNLTGNCGIIDLDPNGAKSFRASAFGGLTGAFISSLIFRDCNAIAGGSLTTSILLHLIPSTNGVATIYSVTTDQPFLRVNNLKISGGIWEIPAVGSAINPFTIGLASGIATNPPIATTTPTNTFGNVTIEDLTIRYASNDSTTAVPVDMGVATTDSRPFFTGVESTSVGAVNVPTAIWGAVAISANRLVIRNLNIRGTTQLGRCGDLFIKADKTCDIDNILISDYNVGSGAIGGAPDQRIRFRFGMGTATALANINREVHVKNVTCIGTDAAVLTKWATLGIITHEPTHIPVLYDRLTVKNYSIAGSPPPAPNGAGFYFIDAASNALYGTTNGNSGLLTHFKLINSFFEYCAAGIDGEFSLLDAVLSWSFIGNRMQTCNSQGALLQTAGMPIGTLIFSNNEISGCGITGNDGLEIVTNDWTSPTSGGHNVFHPITVTGNTVVGNGISSSGVQIKINTTAVVGTQRPQGTILSNICSRVTSSAGSAGEIQINEVIGGAPVALSAGTFIRGVETSQSPFTQWISGDLILYNEAELTTP